MAMNLLSGITLPLAGQSAALPLVPEGTRPDVKEPLHHPRKSLRRRPVRSQATASGWQRDASRFVLKTPAGKPFTFAKPGFAQPSESWFPALVVEAGAKHVLLDLQVSGTPASNLARVPRRFEVPADLALEQGQELIWHAYIGGGSGALAMDCQECLQKLAHGTDDERTASAAMFASSIQEWVSDGSFSQWNLATLIYYVDDLILNLLFQNRKVKEAVKPLYGSDHVNDLLKLLSTSAYAERAGKLILSDPEYFIGSDPDRAIVNAQKFAEMVDFINGEKPFPVTAFKVLTSFLDEIFRVGRVDEYQLSSLAAKLRDIYAFAHGLPEFIHENSDLGATLERFALLLGYGKEKEPFSDVGHNLHTSEAIQLRPHPLDEQEPFEDMDVFANESALRGSLRKEESRARAVKAGARGDDMSCEYCVETLWMSYSSEEQAVAAKVFEGAIQRWVDSGQFDSRHLGVLIRELNDVTLRLLFEEPSVKAAVRPVYDTDHVRGLYGHFWGSAYTARVSKLITDDLDYFISADPEHSIIQPDTLKILVQDIVGDFSPHALKVLLALLGIVYSYDLSRYYQFPGALDEFRKLYNGIKHNPSLSTEADELLELIEAFEDMASSDSSSHLSGSESPTYRGDEEREDKSENLVHGNGEDLIGNDGGGAWMSDERYKDEIIHRLVQGRQEEAAVEFTSKFPGWIRDGLFTDEDLDILLDSPNTLIINALTDVSEMLFPQEVFKSWHFDALVSIVVNGNERLSRKVNDLLYDASSALARGGALTLESLRDFGQRLLGTRKFDAMYLFIRLLQSIDPTTDKRFVDPEFAMIADQLADHMDRLHADDSRVRALRSLVLPLNPEFLSRTRGQPRRMEERVSMPSGSRGFSSGASQRASGRYVPQTHRNDDDDDDGIQPRSKRDMERSAGVSKAVKEVFERFRAKYDRYPTILEIFVMAKSGEMPSIKSLFSSYGSFDDLFRRFGASPQPDDPATQEEALRVVMGHFHRVGPDRLPDLDDIRNFERTFGITTGSWNYRGERPTHLETVLGRFGLTLEGALTRLGLHSEDTRRMKPVQYLPDAPQQSSVFSSFHANSSSAPSTKGHPRVASPTPASSVSRWEANAATKLPDEFTLPIHKGKDAIAFSAEKRAGFEHTAEVIGINGRVATLKLTRLNPKSMGAYDRIIERQHLFTLPEAIDLRKGQTLYWHSNNP